MIPVRFGKNKSMVFDNHDLVACHGFPRDGRLTGWLHACSAVGMSASSNFGGAPIICSAAGGPRTHTSQSRCSDGTAGLS